jgi:transposase
MAVTKHTSVSEVSRGMQIKTILNRIQKHRGFVYGTAQLEDRAGGGLALMIDLYPHARNRPQCSGCGRRGPQYDRLAPRRFEFVPLWGLSVFFLYMMRRVDCPSCGVRVERVPWADGKHQVTTAYAWFLARWAKRLSWREVASVFHTSWDTVYRAVAMAVAWGRTHVDLGGIEAIGFDEIQWQHGQQYLTVVYECGAPHS